MKIPRDLSAEELIKALLKINYTVTRKRGSHIRLTRIQNNNEHHLTIPDHNPIK
ncbi:MAG: type II toxin-antitoxin system HicA family toxin [bacterium]